MTPPITVPTSLAKVQARMAAIDARLQVARPLQSNQSASAASEFAGILDALQGVGLDGGLRGTGLGLPGTSAEQLTAVVEEYVGIPYVWGGTDPRTGLDCSGFTQHLMRRFGVELPRVSADQLRTGTPVADLASARPGDLLGWDTGPRNVGVDHVAVYLGNGLMAEAPGTGGHVQIVPVTTPPDQIRRVLPDPMVRGIGAVTTAPNAARGPYAEQFTAAGARHGVDPQLLSLIAERESGFRPTAVSPAGAQGLMQLMPGTARGLGVTDPFDPAQAIDGAARLLRGHLDTFGTVDKALAAYNAGPGNVRRYGGVPPFAETQAYVAWIGARYGGDGRWT